MREKDIVIAIMRFLKAVPNCWHFKMHGGMYSTAGVPDIIICFHGRFIALEVKTETGKLTKLQEATIAKIQKANGNAYKVTSLQEVKEIIKNLEVETDDGKEIFNAGTDNTNPP